MFLKKYLSTKRYKTGIEAVELNSNIRKISGLAVFQLKSHPEHGITSEFSFVGFTMFLVNISLYTLCAYRTFAEDQTVLRNLYPTKMRHYGDLGERALSILFTSFCMWKIPYHLGYSTGYMRKHLEIDRKFEDLGHAIDHGATAFHFLVWSIIQVIAGFARLLTVLIALNSLDINVPVAVVYQDSITDALALATTVQYCHYVNLIRSRYKILNKLLSEIKDGRSWEQKVLVRGIGKKQLNADKVLNYQDKYVCEKMRTCAKIYGMLFKVTQVAQDMFGFTLVCTMLFCLLYVVLYLFYFMEATASGMFQDTRRYVYLIIYLFWQILYTVIIILLNIYVSVSCVMEASRTSFVIHQIINADISPRITDEAMRFSQQSLHQIPVFTACGLCKVDFTLLLQGTYNVATFLVILLQFVT